MKLVDNRLRYERIASKIALDISVKNLHLDAKLSLLEDRRNSHLLSIMFDIREHAQYISIPVVRTRQADKIVFNTCINTLSILRRS